MHFAHILIYACLRLNSQFMKLISVRKCPLPINAINFESLLNRIYLFIFFFLKSFGRQVNDFCLWENYFMLFCCLLNEHIGDLFIYCCSKTSTFAVDRLSRILSARFHNFVLLHFQCRSSETVMLLCHFKRPNHQQICAYDFDRINKMPCYFWQLDAPITVC